MKSVLFISVCIVYLLMSRLALASEVDVVNVELIAENANQYTIFTTLKHNDTGWKHYANRWEVLDETGRVIATRVLYHPHVDEQPFTRSLSVTIPVGIKRITLRGHDSVHGYGGKAITVDIP